MPLRADIFQNQIHLFILSFMLFSALSVFIELTDNRNIMCKHTYTIFCDFYCCKKNYSQMKNMIFFAHLSQWITRWAYSRSELAGILGSVHSSIHTFIHEYFWDQQTDCNKILSEASVRQGKGCIRFEPDRIRTLFFIATNTS